MRDKCLRTYCRIQAALVRGEDGIEMTEVAGLIAIFVVIAVIAFGAFGKQMGTFIDSLPNRLGF
jgi:Flp pilus assembly pilin Flp